MQDQQGHDSWPSCKKCKGHGFVEPIASVFTEGRWATVDGDDTRDWPPSKHCLSAQLGAEGEASALPEVVGSKFAFGEQEGPCSLLIPACMLSSFSLALATTWGLCFWSQDLGWEVQRKIESHWLLLQQILAGPPDTRTS
jgi:hypothetical protein